MGFPDELWESLFGDGPKAIVPYDPYQQNTELTAELEMVMKFANGDLEKWEQRPWAVRRMWVLYQILLTEKRKKHDERMIHEAEAKRKFRENLPKTQVDRPGVRY